MAKKEKTYSEMPSNFFVFDEENAELVGILVEKGMQSFPNGDVGRYKIQIEDGTVSSFLGSTVLDDLLARIPEGTDLKIVYTGTVQSRAKRAVKQYKLFLADV